MYHFRDRVGHRNGLILGRGVAQNTSVWADGPLAGEGGEGDLATAWGRKGADAHGIGDGVGRSGRKQRSWGLATPCSRGQDAVGGLNASRTSETGMRKLTMRSSLESDSELESSLLSRSR